MLRKDECASHIFPLKCRQPWHATDIKNQAKKCEKDLVLLSLEVIPLHSRMKTHLTLSTHQNNICRHGGVPFLSWQHKHRSRAVLNIFVNEVAGKKKRWLLIVGAYFSSASKTTTSHTSTPCFVDKASNAIDPSHSYSLTNNVTDHHQSQLLALFFRGPELIKDNLRPWNQPNSIGLTSSVFFYQPCPIFFLATFFMFRPSSVSTENTYT